MPCPCDADGRQGIYLVEPHGKLIWDGAKEAIANVKRLPLEGDKLIVSKINGQGWTWGEAFIDEPEQVDINEFDAIFNRHRVTTKERAKWWPDADKIFVYPIIAFKKFDEPILTEVRPGVQLIMEEVKYINSSEDEDDKEAEMPWKSFKQGDNWCVFKIDAEKKPTGRTLGCHPSKDKANAQVAALNIAEDKDVSETEKQQTEEAKEVKTEEQDIVVEKGVQEIDADQKAANIEAAIHLLRTTLLAHEVQHEVLAAEEEPEPMMKAKKKKKKKKKKPYEKKTGRRVQGERVGVLRRLQENIESMLDTLRGVVSWAGYEDDNEDKSILPVMVTKASDGRPWIFVWTTNAFKDRDEEIFTTQSIQNLVDTNANEDKKGEFWFWHLPGTKFADIQFQDVIGRFLLEGGPFDDTEVGQTFKEMFEKYPNGHPEVAPFGWGASHGFFYIPKDREDKVYEWFAKKESTVLPAHFASNPHNPSMEVVNMSEKGIEALAALVGDEFAKRMQETGESKTAELESVVEHKEKEPPAEVKVAEPTVVEKSGEVKPEVADGIALLVDAVVKNIPLDGISEAIEAVASEVKAIKLELAELKQVSEEQTKEKEAVRPRWFWDRASESDTTVLDNDKDAELKAMAPRNVPPAIANIVRQVEATKGR